MAQKFFNHLVNGKLVAKRADFCGNREMARANVFYGELEWALRHHGWRAHKAQADSANAEVGQ